ncbi:MAG TPA: hypothetical protein VEU07_06245, partial [Candidatus Acidoferrum sp.]|nr:hypothetical protein [Candidatus Acidoferrum sp.]
MGRLVQCCFLAAILVLAWGTAASAASVADGFESGTVGSLWRTHRIKSGSATVQGEIVRSGAYALRLELHQGDMAGRGGDGEATERAEITEAD